MKGYRIDNWSDYNEKMVKRGSLTCWFEETAIKGWLSKRKSKRAGRPEKYSRSDHHPSSLPGGLSSSSTSPSGFCHLD